MTVSPARAQRIWGAEGERRGRSLRLPLKGPGVAVATKAGAASAASARVGSVATSPESDWYRQLDTPSWQPPPIAFPLVWTPLYADIAVTSAVALTALEEQGRSDDANGLRRSLALNLVLNAGWLREVDPSLHRAWAPYSAWCVFASALNASIARRNS